jgi:hypothetical protein
MTQGSPHSPRMAHALMRRGRQANGEKGAGPGGQLRLFG